MSWDGYMCLGGEEIINSSRLCQMIAAGKGQPDIQCRDCCPCPDLDKALGFIGGYNPSDNPWYSEDDPDSNDFAGLLVTSITGLEPGAFTRPVTEAAGIGAVLGLGRQSAPLIVVTGLLMASTCCGVEAGYRWLRSALKGSCAPKTLCAGADLTFLSCEPQFPDEDCADDPNCLTDCIAACGPNLECQAECADRCAAPDFEALLEPYYRNFKGAALVSGPTITQIIPRGCPSCYECGFTEVQFTLSAADPCIYREPITLSAAATFTEVTDPTCIEWVDGTLEDADCGQDCATDECGTDPDCVDVDPPAMPSLQNPCVQDCDSNSTFRACVEIPAGTFPPGTEGTLVVSIFAGDQPLRGLRMRVWENPLGLDVDDLADCNVCSALAISYVGPSSTLVLDGATRTAVISCPGGSDVRANPFIAEGFSGSAAFTYPTFVCNAAYTVCITVRPPLSAMAAVKFEVVAREC